MTAPPVRFFTINQVLAKRDSENRAKPGNIELRILGRVAGIRCQGDQRCAVSGRDPACHQRGAVRPVHVPRA